MNIMAWIVLILNSTSLLSSSVGVFTRKTSQDRVLSAISAATHAITIYLMLYILGFIV